MSHRGLLRDEDLSEKQFSRIVYDLARSTNWKRYHTHRAERSPAGWPDEAFVRDRIFFAELKKEAALRLKANKPTELQQEWLTAIASAGGEVYLWIPSDLPEIAQIMRSRATPPIGHFGSCWLLEGGRADGKVIAPPAKDLLSLPIP